MRQGDPIRAIPADPLTGELVQIDGFPFHRDFTGDGFANDAIPFHTPTELIPEGGPAAVDERVEVAIVGGGISGLATAYLLRDRDPLLFELRDNFGGVAMGERWNGIPYSLGSAYVIAPDAGSFLESFYKQLRLDRAVRESSPPDPVEIGGRIEEEFFSGAGQPPEVVQAFLRYAEVVTQVADEEYPEIPLSADEKEAAWVKELDQRSFREDLEERMGRELPPILAAAIQGYFYSSFADGMERISAASGWNFLAAEEFGRWVFPGGNALMAQRLWRRILDRDLGRRARGRNTTLRARSRVIDVRTAGNGSKVLLSYLDPEGTLRTLEAKHVVIAAPKHVAKYFLHDLPAWDRQKYDAIQSLESAAYLVANVLLDGPVERDFYDVFRIGGPDFPMTPGTFGQLRPVVDILRGDYYAPNPNGRSVLTLYWPLAWGLGRASLIVGDSHTAYAERFTPQLREILALLELEESAVGQIRLTRWGHAVPLAHPGFIGGGAAELAQRPLDGRVHFVNQDNWALPAIENCLIDADRVARAIREA